MLGDKISDCERIKAVSGEPSKELRVGAMIPDILHFWSGKMVDFATGAIYNPCDNKVK